MDDKGNSLFNKVPFASRILIVLFSSLILYSVSLLVIDLTVEGTGYSPFSTWSPLQTVIYAICGFLALTLLISLESQNRTLKPRGMIHIPLIMLLTFFAIFSIDTAQILQYAPFLTIFFLTGFVGIIIYGGLLCVYIMYLHSSTKRKENGWDETFSDLVFRGMIVIIVAPMLLIMVFVAIFYLLLSVSPPLFPFYGEGTAGGVLAAAVILSMYFGARLVSRRQNTTQNRPEQVTTIDVLRNFLEGLSALFCTGAAFSLVGGLITGSVPPPLPIPFGIVILGLLVTLPFSLFLSRNEIFEPVEEPQDIAEELEPEIEIP